MTASSTTTVGSWRRAQTRQFVIITIAAVAIYVTLRLLPTGTNLSHNDFRLQGKNSIEFCDPLNPQFIPVVAARSPVTVELAANGLAVAGKDFSGVLSFHTSSGKPVGPEDLLIVHTKPMHLMIVDPSLTDYQHVHPQPGRKAGDWTFSFTPRFGGTYRIFADFTPIATGRGLYASTDLPVAGTAAALGTPETDPAQGGVAPIVVERDGYRYTLTFGSGPMRVRQPADLAFRIEALNGSRVPLGPVMGAYAHLVAFDSTRSGFAHLHPTQADPLAPPEAVHPTLNFKLTIPTPGRYVIWTQINLAGREVFVPFWFNVQ